MKKPLLNFFLIFVSLVGITLLDGCYPNDDISLGESDIIMTAYDDSVSFTTLKTYFMSDTVYPVRDDKSDHSLIENNNLVIQTIADNMAAYGYVRVYKDAVETPDIRISSAAIQTLNISVGWWYPYYSGWGWYWGWYKSLQETSYWYGGYPGYYSGGYWGVPYYSSYTTGTIIIEMANPLDYRVIAGDTVVPIYWAGALNGVLSGSEETRIISGINQAFKQSPQIKTNY
ncbi:MAG: hypothetical protein DRI83_05505 [Bacteroidetes bacterium]|nr:MAG: hypothetical protein DRI83_05505 [Bacteroidota bacterium]